MGVDRIGQGVPPIPVPEAGAPSSGPSTVGPTGAAFQVDKPAASAPAAGTHEVAAPGASSALERFRAGDLDLGGYLDAKVDEATAHLSATLPPTQLEVLRSTLRERISSDPSLVDLVEKATGETMASPAPHDD